MCSFGPFHYFLIEQNEPKTSRLRRKRVKKLRQNHVDKIYSILEYTVSKSFYYSRVRWTKDFSWKYHNKTCFYDAKLRRQTNEFIFLTPSSCHNYQTVKQMTWELHAFLDCHFTFFSSKWDTYCSKSFYVQKKNHLAIYCPICKNLWGCQVDKTISQKCPKWNLLKTAICYQ